MTSIHHTVRAAALAAATLFIGFGAQAQASENFNGLSAAVPTPGGLNPTTNAYGGTNVLSSFSTSLISGSWFEDTAVTVGGPEADNFLVLGRNDSFTLNFSLTAPLSNVLFQFAYNNTLGNSTANNGVINTGFNTWTMDTLSGSLDNAAVSGSGLGNPSSASGPFFATLNFNGLASGNHTFTWNRSGLANSGTLRIDDFSATVTAVPEPETYAMMLAGLGAIGFLSRRRKAAQV
ncbi:PEP-CTERM sorting domain-containing protein [Leptothrix discophora]|uniref:PEP-CTERM sorting domain-containing protein n=1 Tax=Leptothrix discophora TaxID=89 RepID=A0ABT9FXW9_LEPDI|nr:PEP-CTERM sorting domain-containing protein [Leptothrix discophora]MDP4299075.1 PEP-CTERM sorting domain-containing protein [Leptothrix discophora]